MTQQQGCRLNRGRFYRFPIMIHCLAVLLASWPILEAHAEAPKANNSLVEQGRRIYQDGILPSGKPLRGQRLSAIVEGEAAACVKCHRQSGMGSLEGNIVAPPITGSFLFATTENRPLALLDMRAPKNVSRAHAPYTEAALAKVITKGSNIIGKPMSALMPRYALSEPEIKALIAYLRQLSASLPPGIGTDTIRFATVIAPGVDKTLSEAAISMMKTAFIQRNASQENLSGRMKMPLDLIPRTRRNWELAVWQLQGAPETWGKQLQENYNHEPVFAVISGLSNTTWEPVQSFCQQEKLPCLFPSIPLPPSQPAAYSLYFSRGVALEADVLAKHLRSLGDKAPPRLVQIYRDDDVGRGAAQTLTLALKNSGIHVEDRILHGQETAGFSDALKNLTDKDAVMLWLRPEDLSAVNKAAPEHPPATAYVSGFLAAENFSSFSQAWKPKVRLVYPYELGKTRQTNIAIMQDWIKNWHVPSVNEATQTEVFFDLLFLTDIMSQMLDNLYRDYLVERVEDMLSIGSNISIYPRLSLGAGQRYASKGAYIARFDGDKLVPETDWIVP